MIHMTPLSYDMDVAVILKGYDMAVMGYGIRVIVILEVARYDIHVAVIPPTP